MPDEKPDAHLRRLCEQHGIAVDYDDIWGLRHQVSAASLRALLLDAGAFDEAQPPPALPPVLVLEEGVSAFSLPLRLPPGRGGELQWRLVEEDGRTHRGHAHVGDGEQLLSLDITLPLGYHRFELVDVPGATLLICAPTRCHEPTELAKGGRLWGIALQLYGLRSARNWGIGDFGDLKEFATQAAREGAALIGLNPLHALFPHNPVHASPYSPSSRAQLNILYIDVEAVPDFAACEAAQALVRSPAFQARLAALREAPLVDYPAVSAAKHEVLALLHARFRERAEEDGEVQDFRRFRAQGGEALRQHALFDALQAQLHQQDAAIWGWPAWPEAWHDAGGPEVARFARAHEARIQYFEYLQWQTMRQLEDACRHCRALGMPIGLYLDLAVSVDRGGSDTWRHRSSFALAASVGAPPDLLNLQGQDWGLPPLRPDRLRANGFAVFIEALRANMRAAGALRIDHVMMLMRLFWIPAGGTAQDGAYVRYAWPELFAILALESRRHRCLVVGEDLGTVPEEMRAAMRRHGVLSYRLLYFQRDEAGAFLPPEAYPREAVVAVSTHDLPTFAGWWSAADVHLRAALGLLANQPAFEEQIAQRARERERLAEALGEPVKAPAPIGEPPPADLVGDVHAFLARAPSGLMMVQLEDLLGQAEQANLPGTIAEHPNWQRKYRLDVAGLWQVPAVRGRVATVAAARPPRALARIPRATYRLQLHKGFNFDDAAAIVPYLARLGISHVYCSPIHRARPGSLHGYDVVAHDEINPELGGMPAYRRFTETLQAHGMGQLIDLVPNHMGVLGTDGNAWWNDVLEKGMASPYAEYFDIDWHSATPGLAGKVLLPVLDDHYGQVLARGELTVEHDAHASRWFVRYFAHRFPLAPDSLFVHIQAAAAAHDQAALARELAALNGPEGHDALHALLEAQAWRLAYWRCAADEINYRRFFDVNELAALRTEREDVFEATHGQALELAAKGWIDGLRIDHPDGLADPAAYFDRLQAGYAARVEAAGRDAAAPLYVVAEKIAAPGEDVPLSWGIHGTTGYRFANVANGVLVDHRAGEQLVAIWRDFTGLTQDFGEVAYRARHLVATTTLASDLEVLANALHRIAKADRRTRDHTLNSLREALAAVAAAMPVYRSYNGEEASEQDIRFIRHAVDVARERLRQLPDASIWPFVQESLLGRPNEGAAPELLPLVRHFARRFQQYSAPVAAKGVEDTAFYRYFPLSSQNEVGGEPDRIGMTVQDFHAASLDRQRRWPHTMLATSTHDNKRSEDVRLRINLLSERVDAWRDALQRWKEMNAPLAGEVAPAHQYLFYQTVIGALPAQPSGGPDFVDRMVQYMHKAAREGKTGTSWTRPDAAYEAALEAFVRGALASEGGNAFLPELTRFVRGLDPFSALGALSLALLKFTSPGVPDVYQGCELIERSLVDPDNRRPVDYALRASMLQSLQSLPADGRQDHLPRAVTELADAATDGRAKLWASWRLLGLRQQLPQLFLHGSYEPLQVQGERAPHVVAYLRRYRREVVVVIVVRLFAVLAREVGGGGADAMQPAWAGSDVWGDTRVRLPSDLDGDGVLQDVLTGTRHALTPELALGRLLTSFPGAVLTRATQDPRAC
ncbi:malto-oligosyltrehalose synthase [Variovorax sp. LARHSF232]